MNGTCAQAPLNLYDFTREQLRHRLGQWGVKPVHFDSEATTRRGIFRGVMSHCDGGTMPHHPVQLPSR